MLSLYHMRFHKPFIIKNFHGVLSGNPHRHSQKSLIGKVSSNQMLALRCAKCNGTLGHVFERYQQQQQGA